MFQIFFLSTIEKSKKKVLENYSFSYGFAPSGMAKKLQRGRNFGEISLIFQRVLIYIKLNRGGRFIRELD